MSTRGPEHDVVMDDAGAGAAAAAAEPTEIETGLNIAEHLADRKELCDQWGIDEQALLQGFKPTQVSDGTWLGKQDPDEGQLLAQHIQWATNHFQNVLVQHFKADLPEELQEDVVAQSHGEDDYTTDPVNMLEAARDRLLQGFQYRPQWSRSDDSGLIESLTTQQQAHMVAQYQAIQQQQGVAYASVAAKGPEEHDKLDLSALSAVTSELAEIARRQRDGINTRDLRDTDQPVDHSEQFADRRAPGGFIHTIRAHMDAYQPGAVMSGTGHVYGLRTPEALDKRGYEEKEVTSGGETRRLFTKR